MFKAILSTTILPLDGVYDIETVENFYFDCDLEGIPHYIGHPSTKKIVEAMGAVPAPSKLFTGLEPLESALAVSIKQGRSSRQSMGKTVDQTINLYDLDFRIITRLE